MLAAAASIIANTIVCDNPAPLTNFNGFAYMGTWFEI